MKRYPINVALKEENCGLATVCFLKDARSFVAKVFKEDSTTVQIFKTSIDGPDTIRRPRFLRKVQRMVDKNPRKSNNAIAKGLNVSRHSI